MNASIHSFVIRVWLEENSSDSGDAVWRGHITHVESKARRHFDRLGETLDFIQPYLADRNLLWEVLLNGNPLHPVDLGPSDYVPAEHEASEHNASEHNPSEQDPSEYDKQDDSRVA